MTDIGPMPADLKPPVNTQFVAQLEKVLADAKAGKIAGGVLHLADATNALNIHSVMVFPPGLAPMFIAALELMKDEIITMWRQANRGGSILRAGAMPGVRQ